jgi:hypothetical protein
MSSLESLVTDLATSQKLRDAGFPQDTVLVYFHYGNTTHWGLVTREDALTYARMNSDNDVAAPTAGELEEWLRGKVGNPLEETTVIVSHDGNKEVAYCAGVRSAQSKYQIAYGDTDVSALAALVLEVAG